MKNTVESSSGLALDLTQPEPSQITVPDIVHALSMQPHLLGAVSQRYSIAQHILLVHELLRAVQSPSWQKMFLQYFVCKSHVAFTGDIPGAVRNMLGLQTNLTKLFARIHGCVARHIQAVYGVPEFYFRGAHQTEWQLRGVPDDILCVVDAYETYHLMQGGGWSLQPVDAPKRMRAFVEAAWNTTKYRFAFDTPPKIMDEAVVQADLLRKIAEVCADLRPARTTV